jgi:hypothetical protein
MYYDEEPVRKIVREAKRGSGYGRIQGCPSAKPQYEITHEAEAIFNVKVKKFIVSP